MVTHSRFDDGDLHPNNGRAYDRAMALWSHAEMHAWRVTGWVVGATALDNIQSGVRTEDVETFLGYPVRRDCALPRDAIRIETATNA